MDEMIMVCHSLINNTGTGLIISGMCKYKFFDQSDPPESPQIFDIHSVVVL